MYILQCLKLSRYLWITRKNVNYDDDDNDGYHFYYYAYDQTIT
jgi:hypothetical protein